MDFSEESDNISTPPPPPTRNDHSSHESHPEHSDDYLDTSPPPKRPSGRKKKGATNKPQRNTSRTKPNTSSSRSTKPKTVPSKRVRKKQSKESLGAAYISPPSSPSPPPTTDSDNNHILYSPPPQTATPPNNTRSTDHSKKLLSVESSEVVSVTPSIPGTVITQQPNCGATCDRNSDIPPLSGHPDISDLFLDPHEQEGHSVEHPRSRLKHGEDLDTNHSTIDAGIVYTGSWNARRDFLKADETLTTKDHLQHPHLGSGEHDPLVSIDDLFG